METIQAVPIDRQKPRFSQPLELPQSLRRGLGLLLALSAVHVGAAVEGDQEPKDVGWALSGSVRVGAVATWTTSKLDPQYQPATRDLSQEGEYEDGQDLCALIDLQVQAPNGVGLYLTTPLEEYGAAVGVTVPTTLGKWDIQACYVFPDSVWEDPYLLGQAREETDRERYGGTLALNAIGGTRWSASYTVRMVDIELDRAAQAYPELERSGITHRMEVSTHFGIDDGHLQSSAVYERADLDGDAAAFDAATVALCWAVPWRRWQFMLGAEVGYDWYRASHPLFGSTREGLRLAGNAIGSYRDPFGIDGAELGALAAWSLEDSNCDFYDAQSYHLGLFIGYHF